MRRFLLASVATVGLSIAALPALAQDAAVPATPPTTASEPSQEEPAQAPAAQAAGEPQAQENAALAVPTSSSNVCEARTTSVHFGARRSALSRENQNAIEYATDAASVCDLQTVTIVDSAEGRVHSRRGAAIRATLVRQGVSADRITVAQEVNADPEAASTGRVDIRMAFAGAASGGSPATAAAAPMVEPAAPVTSAPAPSVTPQAPDTMTPPPADGGPTGEEVTDPTPST